MKQSWKTITVALLFGYLAVLTHAIADPSRSAPAAKAVDEIVAAYGGEGIVDAREVAEADYRYASDQLAFARAEVQRLLSEIKIEGAESVEIGGEVRAARTTEAAWQRAVDTVASYLARLDRTIAER